MLVVLIDSGLSRCNLVAGRGAFLKLAHFANIYSWPNLVVPYTEELISQPFVDEN